MPSTYLMLLVSMGQKKAVKDVVEGKKCDVNESDDAGTCPVHLAAEVESLDMLKILVDGGAKLDVVDAFKSTPLSIAQEKKNQEMIDYINEKASTSTAGSIKLSK